jgi:hypothetical protein
VDHGVHRSEAVHSVGNAACLFDVGEVPDDGPGPPILEITQGGEPIRVASVDDDLVSIVEQRLCGRPSQTICGARDKDACDEIRPCFARL